MEYIAKLVRAGHVIHLTKYEKPVRVGENKTRRQKKGELPEDFDREIVNQKKAGLRAKRKLMDLIRTNTAYNWRDHEGKPCTTKFLTLTFAENVEDLDYANAEFKKFIKRLNYRVTGKKKNFLEYVAVVEFQQRGAIHYHVIFFNLAYIEQRTIMKIWGHGFVGINAIDHVDDLGAYISKYIVKNFDDYEDPKREKKEKRRIHKGRKRYFVSRGLIKPEVIPIRTQKELERVVAALAPYKTYDIEYSSEYYGTITYQQYNMIKKKI